MKFLIVLSAVALAVFAAEEKTQEKRGLLGLGYGYHDALAAPIAPVAYSAAPVIAAPVAKYGYPYNLGLGYAGAGYAAPIAKVGYAAAPVGYAASPVGYAAAPIAKLGYSGYGYAPAAYGYAAPALAAPYGAYGAFDYGHGLYH